MQISYSDLAKGFLVETVLGDFVEGSYRGLAARDSFQRACAAISPRDLEVLQRNLDILS